MKNKNLGLIVQLIVSGAPLMADLFIPQFAENIGATRPEIGILGSAFAVSMFISSTIFGRISDIVGRKKILLLGFLLSGFFYSISFFTKNFGVFFLIRIFQGIALGIYPGALAAYVHENSGTMDDYAAFGALGIAAFIYLGGVIAGFLTVKWIFIFVGILFIISLIIAFQVHEENSTTLEIPLFPSRLIRKNLYLYLAVFATFTGISITWTYWILFLKEVGASQFSVGYITMINPLTEFIVLRFFSKAIKFRSVRLGIIILSVSFSLFIFVKSLLPIILLQIFSGIGWAFMYAGSLTEIMQRNEEKGTATGVLQSFITMGSIAGPIIAGLVIAIFKNLRVEFLFAGAIIFAGFLLLTKRNFINTGRIT